MTQPKLFAIILTVFMLMAAAAPIQALADSPAAGDAGAAAATPAAAAAYYTVTFGAEGKADVTAIVENGEKAPAQAAPIAPAGKIFIGWYTQENTESGAVDMPFDFTAAITKDTAVFARFAEKGYEVRFLSGENTDSVIMYSQTAAEGGTIAKPAVDIAGIEMTAAQIFTNEWKLKGSDADFAFGTTPVNSNLVFVPVLKNGYCYVWFVSGSSFVDPIEAEYGSLIEKPLDPVREGYTFAGWYTDEERTQPFDFSAVPITATITLYAKWTGNPVLYTIHYWLEKPNLVPDDYPAPIWTEGPGTPPAAATGELSDGSISPEKDQLHDTGNYIFAASAAGFGIAGTKVSAAVSDAGVPADVQTKIRNMLDPTNIRAWNTFAHVAWGDQDVAIDGNGAAVVNVYLTRSVWTMNFVLYSPSAANQHVVMNVRNNTSLSPVYDGEVPAGGTKLGTLTVKAKIDLSLADLSVMPFVTDPVTGDTLVSSVTNGTQAGPYILRGWGPWSTSGFGVFKAVNTVVNNAATSTDVSQRISTYNTSWSSAASQTLTRSHLYVESLDQTRAFGDDGILDDSGNPNPRIYVDSIKENNKTGDIAVIRQVMEDGGGTWYWATNADRQITDILDGFTSYHGYGDGAGNTGNCFQYNGTVFYQLNDGGNSNDKHRYYFYSRNSYDLTFDAQGGAAAGDTGDEEIKFETPLRGYEPADPVRENAEFLGWFESADAAEPFDFENGAMPSHDLLLTARWLVNPRAVRFYGNPSAAAPIEGFTQSVRDGGTAVNPGDLDPAGFGMTDGNRFLGWYYRTASGGLLPYAWDMPVTSDINLYARWDPPYKPHTVAYDLGGGAGTLPKDANRYAIGTQALVMDGSHLTKGSLVFIGWKAEGPESGYYHSGNVLRVTGDMTLTAQYASPAGTLKLTFRQNASARDAKAESWTAAKNTLQTLPSGGDLGFERPRYVFAGWTDAAGNAAQNGDFAPGTVIRVTRDIDLYAVWTLDASSATVHHVLVKDGKAQDISGWPKTYTAHPGTGDTLARGDSLTIGRLGDANLQLFNTAVGVDPFDNTVTDNPIDSVLHTLASVSANPYANTVTFYYREKTAAPPVIPEDDPPAATPETVQRPVIVNNPAAAPASAPAAEPAIEPASEPATKTQVTSAAAEPGVTGTPPAPDVPAPDFAGAAAAQGIPILPGGIPLFGPSGFAAWALLNLLLCIAGAVAAVLGLIALYRRYRRLAGADRKARIRREEFAGASGNDFAGAEGAGRKHTRKSAAVLGIVFAALGAAVFLITENTELPMVLLDKWTIVNAVLFAAEIAALRMAFRKAGHEDEDGRAAA
jgi:uncharacterized repeat protein (TIGR02543 family)